LILERKTSIVSINNKSDENILSPLKSGYTTSQVPVHFQKQLFPLLKNLSAIFFTINEQHRLTFFSSRIQKISKLHKNQLNNAKIEDALSYCSKAKLIEGLKDIENGLTNSYKEQFSIKTGKRAQTNYSLKLKKPASTLGFGPLLIGIINKINETQTSETKCQKGKN